MNYKLKEKLTIDILPLVTKPGRYLGNEYNVIRKEHSKVKCKIALAFPDIYDLGMSHLGLKIFYETINAQSEMVAERVFAPWLDMVEKMRENSIPLYTLESFTPVKEFHILAISLQHELCFTTTLQMLDLSGIPIFSEERKDSDPIVIAGGHATFNPEPMSPYIDLFVIGDGENIIIDIAKMVMKGKEEKLSRDEILHQLAKMKGIYVPSLYSVDYFDSGHIKEIKPILDDIPKRIYRNVVDLEDAYYPTRQLVPYIELAHDRIALEIQRGCTRGCRFCQAGYITRPRRERSIETLVNQAKKGIADTGLSEVALLSLSSSDYDGIKELVTRMVNYFEPLRVSLSLPSLRLDTFSIDIAKLTQRVKKTGFTFAVEAGSERLRNVISKTITDDDLEKAIIQVFSAGWLNAKLYFMIGLPTETYDDLQDMVNLINKTGELARKHAKRHCKITASISVFVPKPHSAFENAEQLDRKEVQKRIFWVKDRITSRVVKLRWHDPEQSYLEGVFSRGDRKVGKAIYLAWKKGCYLDNWSDQFKKETWEKAFLESNIDPDFYAIRARENSEILPWSHIDSGVSRKFLLEEYQDAVGEKPIGDCSMDKFCVACGLEDCTHSKANQKFLWPFQKKSDYQDTGSSIIDLSDMEPSTHFRIKFAKKDELRFISHLDLIRTFTAAIRRSGLPISYSHGFSPQMKYHLAMALSLGYTSISEYAEFQLTEKLSAEEFSTRLSQTLPNGLEILETWPVSPNTPGFGKLIQQVSYRISHFPDSMKSELLQSKINSFLNSIEWFYERVNDEGKMKKMDIRPMIDSLILIPGKPVIDIILNISPLGTVKPNEFIHAILDKDISQDTLKLLHITRTGMYTTKTGIPEPLEYGWLITDSIPIPKTSVGV